MISIKDFVAFLAGAVGAHKEETGGPDVVVFRDTEVGYTNPDLQPGDSAFIVSIGGQQRHADRTDFLVTVKLIREPDPRGSIK